MRFSRFCSSFFTLQLLAVTINPFSAFAVPAKMPIGSGPVFQVRCSADGGDNSKILRLTQSEFNTNWFYTSGAEEAGGDDILVTKLENGTRLFAGADVFRADDGRMRLTALSLEAIAADGTTSASNSSFGDSTAPVLEVGGQVNLSLSAYKATGVDGAGCSFRVLSLGRPALEN